MVLFKGEARYPDLSNGYELYTHRSATTPKDRLLTEEQYNKVVKLFCKEYADRLEEEGMVDLPCEIGSVVAVEVTKRPTFDPCLGKYRTADNIDWAKTRQEGTIVRKDGRKTFGIAFVPRHTKGYGNFRCFGIRANKNLYKRMKKQYDSGTLEFYLPDLETYVR